MKNGENLFVTHGKKKNTKQLAMAQGCNLAQGHYHTQFGVNWFANSLRLNFAVDTGCLVDHDSLAMAYGKNFSEKPILGCVIIQDGIPLAIPMKL